MIVVLMLAIVLVRTILYDFVSSYVTQSNTNHFILIDVLRV